MGRPVIRKLFFVLGLLALSLTALAQQVQPVRVGTTQSLTGQFQDAGTEQLRGLQMWVHDINARGALLGRPVELVYYDDGSDAKRAVEFYRKLINEDKVDLLVGPYSSDLALEATTVAEEYNFPMLTAAGSAEQIWARGYKNAIGIDVPSNNYVDPAVALLAEHGAKTLALLHAATPFGEEVAADARQEAAKQGIAIVVDERYDESQRDFGDLARRIAAANPDVVLGISYLDDSVALTRALKAAGVRPKMLAFTVGPSLYEFGEQLGPDAEGVVGIVQWLRSVRLPGAQDFAYRYRRLYGNDPGVYAAIGYATGEVTEAAVRLANSLDHDAVRQQLLTMEFGSLLGQFSVDEQTGRQTGKRNYLIQWQDGERRLVEPKELAERKLIYPLP